jgi:hypothetical protein
MNDNVWAVCANLLIKRENGYELCKQLPTFYLDGNALGIITPEGCHKIVNNLLNPLELPYIRVLASVAQV